MTEVEFIKNLLEARWETAISGRSTDVPEPHFTLEKKESNSQLRHQDVGYIASGGDTNYTPLGFGWTHETVDTIVAIEYRAAQRAVSAGYDDPYNRLHGKRTGAEGLQAPDRWDGVIGETRRVLLSERGGIAEWDLVGADPFRVVDNVSTGGKNYYRADVVVGLKNVAAPIETAVDTGPEAGEFGGSQYGFAEY